MAHHRVITVTQEGVTASQPGVCISVTSGMGKNVLNATRHYPLRNEWGGIGRIHRLDADGMEFDSTDAAFAYAHQHGYTRRWFRNKAQQRN